MVQTNDIITSEEAGILEEIGAHMSESGTEEIHYYTATGVQILFLKPRGLHLDGDS